MHFISLNEENVCPVNTQTQTILLEGEEILRVVKGAKIHQFDENTYARVRGVEFHNGTLEVSVRSRLLPDAPDFARGFIGIAFRCNTDNSFFESFYIRPTNAMSNDPARRAHGCQYFAYPTYTFSYFREQNISLYEAPIDSGLDQWVTLRAVLQGDRGEFYVGDSLTPTLVVEHLLHGEGKPGGVGLFVDIGTEGFFKDLRIES